MADEVAQEQVKKKLDAQDQSDDILQRYYRRQLTPRFKSLSRYWPQWVTGELTSRKIPVLRL